MDFFDLPGDPAGPHPYSQAACHGGFIFVAGQIADDEPGWTGPAGDLAAETRVVMDRIGRILALSGAGFDDILSVRIFMTDLSGFEAMNAVYQSYFSGLRLPARTTLGVAQLLYGTLLEIDCIARDPGR